MSVSVTRPAEADDAAIKLLIVDDSASDAELMLMELRRARVATRSVVAAGEPELRAALTTFMPDVILCDFGFPGFDGFAAQQIVRETYPDTPLIFVSGTISEDRAVTALQSGAVDYVLKSNLLRLPSAVQRAVREAGHRVRLENSLRAEEERSRQHAQRLEALLRLVNDPTLHEEAELWLAMLGQAAAAIQPGQRYWGTLWRVDGNDLILQAATDALDHVVATETKVGTTLVLEATVIGKVFADGGGTRSWDDLKSSGYATVGSSAANTSSLVITTFTAGGAKWALSFSSGVPSARPLGSQVHAYVEVLASFFANHVQQRWQFDRMQYQQSHDVLTGLLNRSQFQLDAESASLSSTRFGIILVDIDAFHEINEAHGTMLGDAVLVEVGHALQQRAVGEEVVGRIGADVFGIYVGNPPSAAFMRSRAADFAAVFAHAFSTGERKGKEFIPRTASLGIAVAPDDGETFDSLLSRANTALFVAKERDHGSVVFYESGMEGEAQRRATLKNELNEALAGDQFTLYYQPHVEISSGAVAGCEALIRWNHPTRGLLFPGAFIPFAEETGMITRIDDWVMRNSFAAAGVLSELRPDFRLYFNLSGRQAGDPNLIRSFVKAARDGVALKNIGVEITETDAMRNVEATRHVCRALRRLNVRIAIDDFGTGYSSLSSLKRLPVDIVKIDRSFTAGLLNDPHDESIAETIISISDHFGFESLAEGAEQPEEIEWLRRHHCHYVQGYGICYPLPIDAFIGWLAERPVLRPSASNQRRVAVAQRRSAVADRRRKPIPIVPDDLAPPPVPVALKKR